MTINQFRDYLLLVFVFSVSGAFGQINDVQSRMQLGIKYSPAKKWDLKASIRYDRDQNLSQFRRANYTLDAAYALNKHISLGGTYRLRTDYLKDAHRFRLYANAKIKLNKKWSVSSRSMFQHDILYFDTEYIQAYNPQWVFRERISVKYAYTKKWNFSLFTEPFFRLRDASPERFQWRTGLQLSYLYKKRHRIGATYFFQDGLLNNALQNRHVMGIQYTFDMNKPKKKKKQKSS